MFFLFSTNYYQNQNLNVWSNNDYYGASLVVNPIFLVILVSVTSVTLEILVVNKDPDIIWIRIESSINFFWTNDSEIEGGEVLFYNVGRTLVSEHSARMSNMVKIWPKCRLSKNPIQLIYKKIDCLESVTMYNSLRNFAVS